MKLFRNDNRKPLNIKDIVHLTVKLNNVLSIYEKSVSIDPEQKEIVKRLRLITNDLLSGNYKDLFESDISLIDFDVSHERFDDEELTAWNQFFAKNPY